MPSLDLLAMLLLTQSMIQLAFWAASTHCQLMLSFLSTNTPESFSSGHSQPTLVYVLEIAPTHVYDLALDLVELHEVHMSPPLKPVKVPLDVLSTAGR